MAYLGNQPAESYASFERQVFTIVNSQTAYTLTHAVTNENDIRLVINSVVQEPGSGKAYTASNTTLTLSAALVNGTDEMYCVYLGRALQTVNPPNASVGSAQIADSLISGKTALGATPADTDELLISDAGTLKRVDYSYLKSSMTPSFKAHLASNQTISSGSFTKAQLATEVWDTDSAYDNSTNYRFTVPSGEDGKYVFTYNFLFYNLTSGNVFEARLYKNGSGIGGSTFRETGQPTQAQVDNSYTTIINLSAGDYIELFVNQTTGSNQTLYGPNNGDTSLTGYKLIGV